MKNDPIKSASHTSTPDPYTAISAANTNSYIFVSDDTESGNNILELSVQPSRFTGVYDFVFPVGKIAGQCTIMSKSPSYLNKGLTISEDVMSANIIELTPDADEFEIVSYASSWTINIYGVILTLTITRIRNTETGLYLGLNRATGVACLIDISENAQPSLFMLIEKDNLFQIVYPSGSYMGLVVLDGELKVTTVNQGDFFEFSVDNLIYDTTTNSYLYGEKNGESYIIKAKADVTENCHFVMEEVENLCTIYNETKGMFLYASDDTQSGNAVLEAIPGPQYVTGDFILGLLFIIHADDASSILPALANASLGELFNNFSNIQSLISKKGPV